MDPANYKKTHILVPVANRIEPQVEESLRKLEQRGYYVDRRYGFCQLDLVRNRMTYDAFVANEAESIVFIDADVRFNPDDIGKLTMRGKSVCAGTYSLKGFPQVTVVPENGQEIRLGPQAGLQKVVCAATGFFYLTRKVYFQHIEERKLPLCNEAFNAPIYAVFTPGTYESPRDGASIYLGEDFAFCMECRKLGIDIWLDGTIVLGHLGSYEYKPKLGTTGTQTVKTCQL